MKNNNSVHRVAAYLRQEITYNHLKPGRHLKESEIAKKFNLSRVPVREAFRILQSEGYLEVIPNRGSFVKVISPEYVHEASMVYKLLAPELLKIAIPNYNKSTYKKGENILNKIEKCKDFSEIGYLLWDFAKVIFGPSKMKYVLGIIDDMYKHSIRLLNDVFEIKQHQSYDTTVHRKFLELCKAKNPQEAINLWSTHVDNLKRVILNNKQKRIKAPLIK